MKQPFLVDVSVLMLFHARSDHFQKVWDEVRKARPARLFLYQDGPRPVATDGSKVDDPCQSKDWKGIMECRQLVSDENIDWECEVHRLYQERNYGCDPSEFISQRWAFSFTDKCIVLEDDDVPSQSFFPFCKEMLDRYENDERITMIAGFNTESEKLKNAQLHSNTTTQSLKGTAVQPLKSTAVQQQKSAEPSYFFTRAFSIWGWASWSRVVNNWDGNYGFVKDRSQFDVLAQKVELYHQRKEMLRMCEDHAKAGKEFYETIFWAYMMLHDGMAIMPKVNLINNIGMDGGTHYSAQLDLLPRRLRHIFTMKREELTFPLTHPVEVAEHPDYQRLYYQRNAWNNPWRKVQYSIEELYLNLLHGNFSNITRALTNRVRKTLGMNKHA